MKKKNILFWISIILNIAFISYGIHMIYTNKYSKNPPSKVTGKSIIKNPYYLAKESQFETLSIGKNDIVFLGDSITNRSQWEELFKKQNIKNRGIDGDTTDGILNRIDTITKGQPKKIFLMIGINDLLHGESTSHVLSNYNKILDKIRSSSPNTIIYVQSILPNNRLKSDDDIEFINENLEKSANGKNIVYIDLFQKFVQNNRLPLEYTYDGTHLNGTAYLIWKSEIAKYIE